MPELGRCAASMAIRAADHALANLPLNRLPSVCPTANHVRDRAGFLAAHVIELQHDRIAFTAILARMREKIQEHALGLGVLDRPRLVVPPDGALAVR
ncbi:MAG: hypothetical protein ACREX8_10215, partial [Gammaproteobacteria bacterium]